MFRSVSVSSEQRRIRELEGELSAVRRELAELRARAQPPGEAGLLQRVFADRIVLEHLPDFVCLLDRNQTIQYLSRTVPGRDVVAMLGRCAIDFIVLHHRERYIAAFERAWCNCEPVSLEYDSMSGRCWETRFVPIRDGDQVVHMLAASMDTTERVRAQDALRETASRLRHAIDVVGMGTWTRDWANDTLVWDGALCAIFGLTPSQAPKTFGDFLAYVHPEDRERLLALSARGRETGVSEEIEYRIARPSGETRHVLAKTSIRVDAHGRAFGTLGAVFDVTERKRLEEQLSQRKKMEAIGELTSGIAHNFNNVLSIILPNLELCIEDAPPALLERLQDIEHAGLRAADLVRQLMLFARCDPGGRKGTVDPTATLRRIATICQTTFDRRIRVDLEIGPEIPCVRANPGQLEEVLLNICLNARDALMDAGTPWPRIVLTADGTAEGDLRIRVRDNGPGMDEQTHARIFEPFFTTKEIGRGTGLGLASSYAIIADHGGRIVCESRPGDGALFEIVLPGTIPEPTASQRPLAPNLVPSLGSETVLLVDDEELVRRATRSMLTRHGFRVVESCHGQQALALFEERLGRIDVVVLDRSMPGLSGEQVLSKLRELAPRVPIVLLSGQPFESDVAALANAALIKPVNIEGLVTTIRRLLHGNA
jgi:PAS domain S-box-containing protein